MEYFQQVLWTSEIWHKHKISWLFLVGLFFLDLEPRKIVHTTWRCNNLQPVLQQDVSAQTVQLVGLMKAGWKFVLPECSQTHWCYNILPVWKFLSNHTDAAISLSCVHPGLPSVLPSRCITLTVHQAVQQKCVNLLGRHYSAPPKSTPFYPNIKGRGCLSEALSAWRLPMEASKGRCFPQYMEESQLRMTVKHSQAHLTHVCYMTGGVVEGGKAQLHLLCK